MSTFKGVSGIGAHDTADTCVFIASCDNTQDVFRQTLLGFTRHWGDCPFARYVGCNMVQVVPAGFDAVTAPLQTWRTELRAQLAQLPARYRFVILFLDDFLLCAPVATDRLVRCLDWARSWRLCYLRLVPVTRPLLPRLFSRVVQGIRGQEIERIPEHIPYYASLQVSVWECEHLMQMLAQPGTIWDFEHQRLPGVAHYAICGQPPIHYAHVVEKGKWRASAAATFRRAGLAFAPGHRAQVAPWRQIGEWITRLKFELIGYSALRFRRFWAVIQAHRRARQVGS
jgi:hypothetical protein